MEKSGAFWAKNSGSKGIIEKVSICIISIVRIYLKFDLEFEENLFDSIKIIMLITRDIRE